MLVATGELRVQVARTYAFDDVADAIEHGTGGEPGKAVVRIG